MRDNSVLAQPGRRSRLPRDCSPPPGSANHPLVRLTMTSGPRPVQDLPQPPDERLMSAQAGANARALPIEGATLSS